MSKFIWLFIVGIMLPPPTLAAVDPDMPYYSTLLQRWVSGTEIQQWVDPTDKTPFSEAERQRRILSTTKWSCRGADNVERLRFYDNPHTKARDRAAGVYTGWNETNEAVVLDRSFCPLLVEIPTGG